MKTKFTLALIFALSTSAFANPTDKSLEELAKHIPYEALFYGAVEQSLIASRMELEYALAQNAKLTDTERNQALKTYDTYATGYLKSLDTPTIKADLKKSYLTSAKSVFSQKEVDAQIAFYGSTDGQNALKKQPAMTSTFLQNAQNATKKATQGYEDKHLQKLQDELNKTLKK